MPESFAKAFRHSARQGCSRRDAQAQFGKRRRFVHLAKCLIKDRHAGENRGAGPGKIVEHRARHAIVADHHRHPADQKRRDQIAEAVGMGERNHSEIQVCIGDAHRVANLDRVGE